MPPDQIVRIGLRANSDTKCCFLLDPALAFAPKLLHDGRLLLADETMAVIHFFELLVNHVEHVLRVLAFLLVAVLLDRF